VKSKEVSDHYLTNTIQNELISLLCNIRSKKWWFPFFVYGLEAALQNAYQLYRARQLGSGGVEWDHLSFRRYIVQKYGQPVLCGRPTTHIKTDKRVLPDIQYDSVHHWPAENATQWRCNLSVECYQRFCIHLPTAGDHASQYMFRLVVQLCWCHFCYYYCCYCWTSATCLSHVTAGICKHAAPDCRKFSLLDNIFGTLQKLYTFTECSPSWHHIYAECLDKLPWR